jgi:hypothetical protein
MRLKLKIKLAWDMFLIHKLEFQMKLKSRIRLRWDRLWIRKDPFHKSLDMDGMLMANMTPKQFKDYQIDLVKRRNKAYQKDLEK